MGNRKKSSLLSYDELIFFEYLNECAFEIYAQKWQVRLPIFFYSRLKSHDLTLS